MSKHQLYYSTRCRFCQAFLEELATTPFVPEFKLICVDPSPSRPPLPGWLKSVPALLVAGESTPRVGPGPVNNWLFEKRIGGGGAQRSAQDMLQERNAPVSPPAYSPDMAPRPDASSRMPPASRSLPPAISSSQKADSSMSPPSIASGEGPLAYHGTEMGADKWSDAYSFLDNEFTSEKGFNPIGRNFESLIPESAMGGGGAMAPRAAAAAAPKRSAKEDALLREFEAFQQSRDRDIPGPLTRR